MWEAAEGARDDRPREAAVARGEKSESPADWRPRGMTNNEEARYAALKRRSSTLETLKEQTPPLRHRSGGSGRDDGGKKKQIPRGLASARDDKSNGEYLISHFRDHMVAASLKDIQFECGSFR